MHRDELLAETFVVLADTLIDDFDVIDFLQTLSERCVDLLGVTGAGVMLCDGTGALRHAAGSSEPMRQVELLELQVAAGPGVDAFRLGAAVRHDDLRDGGSPWPEFAQHAVAAGFAAVTAVPMRLRADTLGALDLFSADPPALGDDDVRVARALADVATIGILQERAVTDSRARAAQLQAALRSRIVIEQAKGIVAESRGIGVDEAFAAIRAFARRHNRRRGETARDLVRGRLRPRDLARSWRRDEPG